MKINPMKTVETLSFTNTFARDIIPVNEDERLNALRSYNLLDSPSEEAFQNLAHLVAEHFNVPIALISLVDEKEVFFKANVGMGNVKSTSRGVSFCSLAILSDEPTVIDNPVDDPCFLANPLVHGAFGLRFYAAAPLITPDGYRIGAVCIVDKKQRSFSEKHEQQLVRFSKVVMHEMELRLRVQQREEKLREEAKRRHHLITRAVIDAQEQERTRLGLELHDNVCQMLTTVKLYNEIVLEGSVNTREMLQKSSTYLQECINEVRFISHQLSTPTLGEIALESSLQELTKSINSIGKVEVKLKTKGIKSLCLNKDLHLCIYRIVQEQLNNILKYAAASEAVISVSNTENGLQMEVSDNGAGFDVNAKRSGIGFLNMKTRAENFGGTLHIQSAPGSGTRLLVVFPSL